MSQERPGHTWQDCGHSASQAGNDRLGEVKNAAGERIRDAAASTQEMAENIADQAREYGTQAQNAATRFGQFVETSVKEQPLTTLAAVAVLSFVLGALWRK